VLANVASSDPFSCTPVQEPSLSHGNNTLYVSLSFLDFLFQISSAAKQLLVYSFSFSMHRLAIHCVVSIATSKASSPGRVLQIALDGIGYVVSRDRICILGTGEDMKGSRHRLAKHTSAVASEDCRKPQIITGSTLFM